MMRPRLGLGSKRVLFPTIVVLALWATLPFFAARQLGVSGPLGGLLTTLQILVITLPIAGIVAAAYGWYYKAPVAAFITGIIPYIPLVFLGIPAVLFLGTPMGVMGAGSALLKQEREIVGGVLLLLGVVSWAIITALIFSGFR